MAFWQLTSEEFLALVEDQIYQLVVPAEGALELPPSDALDPDRGVLEACKLEDALLLGPAAAAPASSTTSTAASAAAASTAHVSLRSVWAGILSLAPFALIMPALLLLPSNPAHPQTGEGWTKP